MSLKRYAVLVGLALFAWPVVASACPFPVFYGPYLSGKMDLVIRALIQPDDETGTVFGADLGLKLGDKVQLRPAVAQCSAGDFSATMFGAGLGIDIWHDAANKTSIALRSAATFRAGSTPAFAGSSPWGPTAKRPCSPMTSRMSSSPRLVRRFQATVC